MGFDENDITEEELISTYNNNLSRLDTDIYGLKYRPSLEPEISDDADTFSEFMGRKRGVLVELKKIYDKDIEAVFLRGEKIPVEGLSFPRRDREIIKREIDNLGDSLICAVEIGVTNSQYEVSSAKIVIDNMPKGAKYIGIDKVDRSSKLKGNSNVYFLRTDSSDIETVREYLDKLEVDSIDYLFIDGKHSVNQVVDDWRYAELVQDNGVILLHDTTLHPGPYTLFDAIDESIFEKEKYFVNVKESYGISVIRKK